MTRRRYTKPEKLAVIADAEVIGGDEAARKHHVPRSTLQYWLDDPQFAELRSKTREEMRDGFRVLVHKAQERLTQLVPTMEPRDLTVLLGVATDKNLLMSGDATSRTESTSITHGLPSDVQRRLRDRLARSVRGESDAPRADGDPDGAGADVDSSAPPGTA